MLKKYQVYEILSQKRKHHHLRIPNQKLRKKHSNLPVYTSSRNYENQ